MEKTRRPVPWLSGGLAVLAALFIMAVMFPNTGKVVVDHSVSPPESRIEAQPALVCQIAVVALLPAVCIFTLGRRWILFDWLAWIFHAMMLAGVFLR
jgi:hypothetical protein